MKKQTKTDSDSSAGGTKPIVSRCTVKKMTKKTLVKAKIVLSDDGKTLTTYLWERTFLCFGRWYPFGCTSSSSPISASHLDKINDNTVSSVLYDAFIVGQ